MTNQFNDIQHQVMNYSNYYNACPGQPMDIGVHGPEKHGDTVYCSIYHYLEFIGIIPSLYNTFNLGNYLTQISSGDFKICKYSCQNFSINKFPVVNLINERDAFERFRK